MSKVLMKGNEAFAEACLRAGCRFFSGYPITPQSEIPEYLSWRMEEVGGVFVQTESELAGINMLFGAASTGKRCLTSSSGPGYALMQEGISYLCGTELPAVILDVQRIGNALGDITTGQGDYWALTRGGGHGDYRTIVLAPASVQEQVDLASTAFDLAEKYTHPVLMATDAATGQMVESVELPEMKEHDPLSLPWAFKPRKIGEKKVNVRNIYKELFVEPDVDGYREFLLNKYNAIVENEQRWEAVQVEDAEVVIVAYGITSRIAKSAIRQARAQGIKLGLIRPITLWPFPQKAFDALGSQIKGIVCAEINILGQTKEDVVAAVKHKLPVESYLEFSYLPTEEAFIAHALEIIKKY